MDYELTIIGRAEHIQLADYGTAAVPAKVDTGADISSVWASNVTEQAGQLQFTLFGPGSPYYSGHVITLGADDYRQTRIANSFGHKELRYVVKLRITLKGRTIRASFTLANRADKLYPILIGRKLLKNKFLVDVARGQVLHDEEQKRKRKLARELQQINGTLGV